MVTRSFSTLDRLLTLNRALDQSLAPGWIRSGSWIPALDIVETKDAYEVHAELPGVAPAQVEVGFERNVLTIRGTKTSGLATGDGNGSRVHASERAVGSFERTIRVPEFVDAERIDARFENGLLTVRIPKAKAAQPRRIEIHGGRKAAEAPATEPSKN